MRLLAMTFVSCLVGTNLHATQYICTSTETCHSRIGCEKKVVPTLLTISKDAREMKFGKEVDAPRFQLGQNTQRTLLVGTSGAAGLRGAGSLVVFETLEFVLTSTVEIEFKEEPLAMGIIVRGHCEEVMS